MDAERILHVSLRNTEAGMRKAGWISSAAVLRHRKLDHSHVEFSAVCFLGWARNHGMEASKFPDAQRAFVVKQGKEGTPVAEICRKAGISQATYLNLA